MVATRLKRITPFWRLGVYRENVLAYIGLLGCLYCLSNLLHKDRTKGQWRKRWLVVSLLFLHMIHKFRLKQKFLSLCWIEAIMRIPLWIAVHKKHLHFIGSLDFHVCKKGKLSSIVDAERFLQDWQIEQRKYHFCWTSKVGSNPLGCYQRGREDYLWCFSKIGLLYLSGVFHIYSKRLKSLQVDFGD